MDSSVSVGLPTASGPAKGTMMDMVKGSPPGRRGHPLPHCRACLVALNSLVGQGGLLLWLSVAGVVAAVAAGAA